MDGEVYACFVRANLPCDAQANMEGAPTQDQIDFCQQNSDSDFVPVAVTGRETVCEWRCFGRELCRHVTSWCLLGFSPSRSV
jgi:hypothetical protein